MEEIELIQVVIGLDELKEGYYRVAFNVKQRSGGYKMTEFYRGLTYTEAIDVLLLGFDDNRPGIKASDREVQEPLW